MSALSSAGIVCYINIVKLTKVPKSKQIETTNKFQGLTKVIREQGIVNRSEMMI